MITFSQRWCSQAPCSCELLRALVSSHELVWTGGFLADALLMPRWCFADAWSYSAHSLQGNLVHPDLPTNHGCNLTLWGNWIIAWAEVLYIYTIVRWAPQPQGALKSTRVERSCCCFSTRWRPCICCHLLHVFVAWPGLFGEIWAILHQQKYIDKSCKTSRSSQTIYSLIGHEITVPWVIRWIRKASKKRLWQEVVDSLQTGQCWFSHFTTGALW